MSIFSWVGRALRSGSRGFSEYERLVLDAVAEHLPPGIAERFVRRVQAVNLVQRLDGGREVNCYAMQNGRAVLDSGTRVDASTGERILARFRIDGTPQASNAGQVWLVDGNLFSIEFRDATEHAESSQVTAIAVEIADNEADPPREAKY